MTIEEYITVCLPTKFKIHPAYVELVSYMLQEEKKGNKLFAQKSFKTPRERAALAIPYQIDDLKERERVLNVLELLILEHRRIHHKEDWNDRIAKLRNNTLMTKEEAEIMPMGFWSG